jgi:O-antigen ligase
VIGADESSRCRWRRVNRQSRGASAAGVHLLALEYHAGRLGELTSEEIEFANSMISLVLALGAVISVLAFGGVERLAFAPVEMAVVIVATVVSWRKAWPPIPRPTLFVLGTLLAIPLLQLIPLPRSLLAAFCPARVLLADNLDRQLASMISAPHTLALTVNSYETQSALLRLVCYVLVFFLAYQVYSSRGKATGLIGVLLSLGVLEAAIGVVQDLTGWKYIFYYNRWVNIYEASGTYINRNHFAGLLEMALPFVLAGILLHRGRQGTNQRSAWVELVVSPFASLLLRDLVLFALIFVGLVFSRSRMGIAAAMAATVVVGAIFFLQSRSRWSLVLLLFVLLPPVCYSLWIGLTPVVERYQSLTQPKALEEDRLPVWRDTGVLIRDYPLLGTGLGTYSWSSRHYQSSFLGSIYGHAHNDYLEFAADIGIPAAVLLFGSLWVLVARVARRAHLLRRSRDKIVAAGCAGAMAAILIHGITDFNLQIPSNAFIFAWIAGTGAALLRKPVTDPTRERAAL